MATINSEIEIIKTAKDNLANTLVNTFGVQAQDEVDGSGNVTSEGLANSSGTLKRLSEWNPVIQNTNVHTSNELQFEDDGSGVEPGSSFDGSEEVVISYNSVGAAAADHEHDEYVKEEDLFEGGILEGYVDLGLPSGTLWASCNLGANYPEEYGDYYMWGSTTPNTNDVCDWEHAPYHEGTQAYRGWTKYITIAQYGTIDNKTVLDPEDDAAYQATGGRAHIPTKENFEELLANTTSIWTTENGVNGRRFTASNGNSIFIPASGSRDYPNQSELGESVNVWSSSLLDDGNANAWQFGSKSDKYSMTEQPRSDGNSVRPVCDPTSGGKKIKSELLADYAKIQDIPTTLDDLADGTTRKLSNYLPLLGGTMTGTINSQDILPKANNTYNLGNNAYRYSSIWGSVLNVGTPTQNTNYGPSLIQSTHGWFSLLGPDSTTANEHTLTTLAIGNSGDYTTTNPHQEGRLRLYSAGSGSHEFCGVMTNNNYQHYLPNVGSTSGYSRLVATSVSSQVGSSTQPVYINANGEAVACDNSIPDASTLVQKIADWHGSYNCQGDYYWHFADVSYTGSYYFVECEFKVDSRYNPPFNIYIKIGTGATALDTTVNAFIHDATGSLAKCYYVPVITDNAVVYQLYIQHKNCDAINYQLIHQHNNVSNNVVITQYNDVADNRITELPAGAVEITKKNEFVSLSGDTMTGALTINHNVDQNHLILQGYNNRSDILFKTNLNDVGRIGIDRNWGVGMVMQYNNKAALSIGTNDSPTGLLFAPDGANWYKVLHTGAQTFTDAEKTQVKTNIGLKYYQEDSTYETLISNQDNSDGFIIGRDSGELFLGGDFTNIDLMDDGEDDPVINIQAFGGSVNFITDDVTWNNYSLAVKADKRTRSSSTWTLSVLEATPPKFVNCTNPMTALTFSTIETNINEQIFYFTTATTGCTISVPESTKIVGDLAVEPDTSYVIAILDGILVIRKIDSITTA